MMYLPNIIHKSTCKKTQQQKKTVNQRRLRQKASPWQTVSQVFPVFLEMGLVCWSGKINTPSSRKKISKNMRIRSLLKW